MTKENDDSIFLKMVVESIEENKKGVDTLYDILCKGYSGQGPLLARVLILEKGNKDTENRVTELENFHIQFKIEDRKAKWHFMLVVVISILGWLTAIITHSGENLFQWLTSIIK